MEGKPSLSKGVFAQKAKKTSPVKRKPVIDEQETKLLQFRKVWNALEERISNVTNNIYQEASTFVVDFINNCHSNDHINPTARLRAIPTIALIMGVNIPDHSSMFGLLSTSLLDSGAIVASLQSRDCANLSLLLQKLVQTVTQEEGKEVNIKRADCTFETLASWYEKKNTQIGSPYKKRKVNRQPLVIMLEDVEAFPPNVLQSFILICNHYLDCIPLVLVLGIATAMVNVHSLLPLKVTSCLAMKIYTSPSASHVLNTILDQVLINSDLPFRVGPKVFEFLTDTIIYHDFSVSNLSHIMKFCVFEHFFNNPPSALTFESMATQTKIIMNNLPSFQKYLEEKSGINGMDNKNTMSVQKTIQSLLKDLHNYNHHLKVTLKCLFEFAHDLPGFPLGRLHRELYLLFLRQSITETEEYQKALKLSSFLGREELEARLVKVLKVLSNTDIVQFIGNNDLADTIRNTVDHLQKLLEGPEEEKEEQKETKDVKICSEIKGKITRHALQELLKSSMKRPKTKFELWRDDVIASLDIFFKLLPPLNSVPLHEALYFDDVATVKAHLNASPKMAIHTALVDPQKYLQCECCVLNDDDEIPKTLPAISLAYKLMLEGGKLINIHDWLQSYLAIKNQNHSPSPKKRNKNSEANEEKICQAEFFQALSELQMLGIVKPNKRKTDHVARLTWGCC